MARTLRIGVSVRLSGLTKISEAIEKFCDEGDVPMPTAFRVNLAVQELVTNSVTHGDFQGREPKITVVLEQEGDEVRVTVEDNAEYFDPFKDAPPPDLESSVAERMIGGLGVHLVRNIVDKATHEHADGKNRIRLVSSLT